MTVAISRVLETQSALCRAVRGAIEVINDDPHTRGLKLSGWPVEKAGCLYTLAVTLEAGASELGECRFTIDLAGEVHFSADDQPIEPCSPDEPSCHAALADFVNRRAQAAASRAA